MTSPAGNNPAKRQRLENGPHGVDQQGHGCNKLPGAPELGQILKSTTQLSYLQAHLAATESLYSAYEAEFDALAKQLFALKRAHLGSGQPLWKGAGGSSADVTMRQQQLITGKGGEDDLDTFSDLEEELLLVAEGPATHPSPPQHPPAQDQQPQLLDAAAGFEPQDAATAAAAADAAQPSGPQPPDGLFGDGSATDAALRQPAAVPAGDAAGAGEVPDSSSSSGEGGLTEAARARLEALEATCSAVAQEDMEAQGALASLVGRTGKYYLRSTVVTLGRSTETKGDVDVDLSPEEGPPPASRTGVPPVGDTGAGSGGTAAVDGQPPTGAAAGEGAATGGSGGGHRVSRRQAVIRLGPDGQFRLVNMGRQPVLVNDVVVDQHQTVNLPHLSLIEVAAVRLLFMANLAAVGRVVRRSAALVL